MPLDTIGLPAHEAVLPRQGVKAALHRRNHREAARMRRQTNVAQMEEQIKTPEKELNNMEISNLSGTEFNKLVIRMLKEITGYFSIKYPTA